MKKLKRRYASVIILVQALFFISIFSCLIVICRYAEGVSQGVGDIIVLALAGIVITVLLRTGLVKKTADKVLNFLHYEEV